MVKVVETVEGMEEEEDGVEVVVEETEAMVVTEGISRAKVKVNKGSRARRNSRASSRVSSVFAETRPNGIAAERVCHLCVLAVGPDLVIDVLSKWRLGQRCCCRPQ